MSNKYFLSDFFSPKHSIELLQDIKYLYPPLSHYFKISGLKRYYSGRDNDIINLLK